jgi:hypothetical protein
MLTHVDTQDREVTLSEVSLSAARVANQLGVPLSGGGAKKLGKRQMPEYSDWSLVFLLSSYYYTYNIFAP